MSDAEEMKLLELGRELSEHLQRRSDPHTGAALVQARQRALQQIAARAQAAPGHGRWFPAAAAAGVAALGIALFLQLWNGGELQPDADEHGTFMMKTFTAEEAPWDENPEMLENMEFTLWLDMAGPEDAG